MISLQALLDASYYRFVIQEFPPAVEDGQGKCVTSIGDKCSLGLCIPPWHEALHFPYGLGAMIRLYPELFDDQMRAMSYAELQKFHGLLHDDLVVEVDGLKQPEWAVNVEELERHYGDVAKLYGLEIMERAV